MDAGDNQHKETTSSANGEDAVLSMTGLPESRNAIHRHDVKDASYPLPEPLSGRLRGGVMLSQNSTKMASGRKVEVLRDEMEDSLAHLVGNSIEAIDQMYFAAPPRLRRHAAFHHRLCLRIRTDPAAKTLSLTDLGAGMTRADLINSLGIGRAGLSSRSSSNDNNKKKTSSKQHPRQEGETALQNGATNAEDPVDTTDEEEFEYSDDDCDDDDGEEETEEDGDGDVDMEEGEDDEDEDNDDDEEEVMQNEIENQQRQDEEEDVFDCRASEIGGFYAAMCALGMGIRVGTKSKFDDYYEFQVGIFSSNEQDEQTQVATAFDSFRIKRPMEEGSQLTVQDGFDQFQDVRGDSGTCITIRLNETAIAKGFLDESILKAVFLKIVETTQYTVAFSTDDQADEIIQASAKEMEAIRELESPKNDVDALEAVASIELGSADTHDEDTSREYNSVKERAKYIPLRLTLGERKMLRLVEATMNCCDYTTSVDRPFQKSVRRTHEQLRGITAVLQGLVTSCDYNAGQKLLADDDYAEHEQIFRQMFEIARRHKIMNPEKMRTEYGKLIYLLQDAVSPSLAPHLGFTVTKPIESVYKFLEERYALDLLSDKFIETATAEITAGKKTRPVIEKEIKAKERAVAVLKKKYATRNLSSDDIHNCLYSICDNNSFLNSNRVPVDKVIDFLTTHFSPSKIEDGYSLSIVSGEDGARLSHSHERQYYFALQSLTLWRDIIDDMFRLWAMAEDDLLSESVTYSLQDTGQGMQRVQQCPRTYKAMQTILSRVQSKVRHWVGSSVIHMGDHNVPNALSFIDKYTQGKRDDEHF